jgi:hypothetical protein
MPKKETEHVVDAEVTETAVSTREDSDIVLVHGDGMSNMTAADIDIPRLNLIQKTSDIDGELGAIVLDKQYSLAKADTNVPCVVILAAKGWKEDVPYDSDIVPKTAANEADAEALRLSSTYPVIEFAELTLLLQDPTENTEGFDLPIGDKNYALGKLYVAKDAYRQTFKRLATYALFHKGKRIQSIMWNLRSGPLERGKYSWFCPGLTATDVAPPADVVEFLSGFGV